MAPKLPTPEEIKWKLRILETKARYLSVKAGFALSYRKKGLEYDMAVSTKKHERALTMQSVFDGELMHYVAAHPFENLAVLQPTTDQRHMLMAFTQAASNQELVRNYSKKLFSEKQPYIGTQYKFPHGSSTGNFVSKWNTVQEYPLGFNISTDSNLPWHNIPGFWFNVFPEQIFNTETYRKYRNHTDDVNIGVFNEGKRIIVDIALEDSDEILRSTYQYHLVGAFDGEESGKTYWIYGNNSANDSNSSEKKEMWNQEKSFSRQ